LRELADGLLDPRVGDVGIEHPLGNETHGLARVLLRLLVKTFFQHLVEGAQQGDVFGAGDHPLGSGSAPPAVDGFLEQGGEVSSLVDVVDILLDVVAQLGGVLAQDHQRHAGSAAAGLLEQPQLLRHPLGRLGIAGRDFLHRHLLTKSEYGFDAAFLGKNLTTQEQGGHLRHLVRPQVIHRGGVQRNDALHVPQRFADPDLLVGHTVKHGDHAIGAGHHARHRVAELLELLGGAALGLKLAGEFLGGGLGLRAVRGAVRQHLVEGAVQR